MKLRLMVYAVTLTGVVILGGCANQPKTLYYWGDYQGQVYRYLQHADTGDVTKQVLVLEEGYEKAKAENKTLAPGYHAHLGMLYYAQGQADKAVEQFALEKAEFPESTIFIDRMLATFKQ